MKALLQNNPLSESEKKRLFEFGRCGRGSAATIIDLANQITIKMNGFRDGNDKRFVDACKNTAKAFRNLSKTLETFKNNR